MGHCCYVGDEPVMFTRKVRGSSRLRGRLRKGIAAVFARVAETRLPATLDVIRQKRRRTFNMG